jgi:hypothetical protein
MTAEGGLGPGDHRDVGGVGGVGGVEDYRWVHVAVARVTCTGHQDVVILADLFDAA